METREDGAALRRFRVRHAEPFLRWMLALEGEARILSPPSVREDLAALARRVAEGHGGAVGTSHGGGDRTFHGAPDHG